MVEYNTITIHYSQKFYLIIIGLPYDTLFISIST